METALTLTEVDEAQITIVMDNAIDVFMDNIARRFDRSSPPADGFSALVAEHGFSALIRVRRGNDEAKILLDTGMSARGVLHNMSALEIDPGSLEAIVLSHGHLDHTLGLPGLLEASGSKALPVICHPDAFLDRKLIMANKLEADVSAPKLTPDQKSHACFSVRAEPNLIADGMVLVSGEIPRITDFEKGLPSHYTKRAGVWEHDPLILDDQCLILRVRGKGLVVITGCCHSGLINTVHLARKLTDCPAVHGLIGGFHLTGKHFESIIPRTIEELQKIRPDYLMPGHCTGWSAAHQIANALPEAFITNNVGKTLTFRA